MQNVCILPRDKGFLQIDTEIITFEITNAERRKLSYDKNRYKYIFVIAMCISTAIGFLLRLIGLIAKPQNTNLSFFESAILPSTVIAVVFFFIATVQLVLCWIPKANERYTAQFDPLNQMIEISGGRKNKEIRSTFCYSGLFR